MYVQQYGALDLLAVPGKPVLTMTLFEDEPSRSDTTYTGTTKVCKFMAQKAIN